ncbi:transposase [Streptomyces kanamyceticus]|uniref:transposase n=1 Tax=Streptomyces kanamyceticus TaxID=1967 RepID=UPI003B848413
MDDDLWEPVEPLPPPWPERAPGAKPVSDRLCLQGILYVLFNDAAWQLLPLELRFGSGQICWRRLDPHVRGRLSRRREKEGDPQPVRRRSTGARRAVNTA